VKVVSFIRKKTQSISFSQKLVVSLCPDFASRVARCPPTGLNRIVGSGGKRMRVRIINPLKINDYGNQED
jgi:hypothetical protein